MKKKISIILLLAAVLATLCACGNKTEKLDTSRIVNYSLIDGRTITISIDNVVSEKAYSLWIGDNGFNVLDSNENVVAVGLFKEIGYLNQFKLMTEDPDVADYARIIHNADDEIIFRYTDDDLSDYYAVRQISDDICAILNTVVGDDESKELFDAITYEIH